MKPQCSGCQGPIDGPWYEEQQDGWEVKDDTVYIE